MSTKPVPMNDDPEIEIDNSKLPPSTQSNELSINQSDAPLPAASEESNVARTTKRAAAAEPEVSSFALLSVESPRGQIARVEAVTSDLVLEIRQFLLSCPQTCEWTCYHLSYDGQIIGDYNEIGAYPELCDGAPHTLKLVPELYDERAARAHVTRTREIIASPPFHINHSTLVTVDELKEKEAAQRKKKQKEPITPAPQLNSNISLSELSSHVLSIGAGEPAQPLVHSIIYSAWNPPPGNRKLRGDLLYLAVDTIEGHNLHITGAVDGWYLNRSTATVFDARPAPTPFRSDTLTQLIRSASQIFSTRFDAALQRTVTLHPFTQSETMARPITWAMSKASVAHKPDWNRSENATLSTFGMDLRGGPRDWNEEFQGYFDMPILSQDDGPRNDSHLQRMYAEFVAAAREGAQAVVNGHISAANPLDDPRHHVFIFNAIFFSYAVDTRGAYTDCGGDEVARKHAGCDLKGIESFLDVCVSDLHNLATCLVDYRGHRVVCQSIIPGIFHADRASKHVYGSMEGGEIVDTSDEDSTKMVELIGEAAKITHGKPHHVIDRAGKSHDLVSSVDTKGIIGSDHRQYVLDLFRTTPRDSNWPEEQYTYAVFRNELVTKYCRQKVMNDMFPAPIADGETEPKEETEQEREERQMHAFLVRQSAQMKKQMEKEKADAEKRAEAIKNGETVEAEEPSEYPIPEIDEEYLKQLYDISFNNDVLVHIPSNKLPEEEAASDLVEVQKLGAFLKDNVLPSFVRRLKSLELTPADGDDLIRLMHSNGINARYLGWLAENCEPQSMSHLVFLTQTEMIARCARDVLNAHLRELQPRNGKRVEAWFYGAALVKFLNSLIGLSGLGVGVTAAQAEAASAVLAAAKEKRTTGKSSKKAVRLADGSKAVEDPLAAVNLWQAIRESAKHKYRYDFSSSVVLTATQKLSLLRSVCRKTGIKVLARDYSFAANEVLSIEDIVDLEPVTKKLNVKSADAEAIFSTVQVTLNQNQLGLAYQYLSEALSVSNAIYGPVAEKTASVYEMLAMVCYQARELAPAADFQQRAVVVYERCFGLDDARTAHAHMSLALFLHSAHLTEAALVHATRSTYLLRLLTGGLHPDVAAAYHNLAMLYQSQGKYADGFIYAQRALEVNVTVLGDQHLQVGFSHHAMAVAHALMGDYREAVQSETRCKRILTAELGATADRVALSNKWLENFASLSVKAQGQKTVPAATPQAIIPPSLKTTSPFLWMNLHTSSQSFRSRFRIDDVLALIENGPITERRNQHRQLVTERALKEQATIDASNPMLQSMIQDGEEQTQAAPTKSKKGKKAQAATVAKAE